MTGALLQGVMPLCARVAGVLVGSAWKGLALVALVALLLRCLPRLSAGMRSAVWTAVLLLVLLLPLLQLQGAANPGQAHGVVHAGFGWSLLIVAAWGVLALLRLAQLAVSAVRLRSIAHRAIAVDPSGPIALLLTAGPRQVSLAVSADVSRPSVAGFFRPQILLPAGLLEELSADELQHVMLHELEHLRRRDDWTNLLQKLALALFPLHPAMFWLDRRLCRERELACDDGVLRATRARKAYAACLARLAEDSMVRRGLSLALGLLGMGERRSELSGRVHRILRSPAESMGRTQMRFAAAALLASVFGGTVLLANGPRLVSFGAVPQAAIMAESRPAVVSPSKDLPAPARLVAAKAVMPQRPEQAPRLVKAFAVNRKPRTPLPRMALAQPMHAPEPYVVLAAWHEQMAVPRMILTMATDVQLTQVSQTAYAAVPVRGGWLLIQL